MEPNIAAIANLIGDPARARILIALMGGKALSATELATEAQITASTASSHLTKLVSGQLLVVRKQGRHRYFQLAGHRVAELLEDLLNVAAGVEQSRVLTGPHEARLRKARICYDHLAGEIGVRLYQALCDQGLLVEHNLVPELTESGRAFFTKLGANLDSMTHSKRPLCRACLDWSERRSHLAGSLGQWVLEDMLERGWASRNLDSRAVSFSQEGLASLFKRYGLETE